MSGFTTNELLYPLTKGEAVGHPVRGNQWTTVGGITPEVANFITTNANKFYKAGGKVEELSSNGVLANGRSISSELNRFAGVVDKIYEQLRSSTSIEERSSLRRILDGLNFLKANLRIDPDKANHILVATNKDGEIVGTIHYVDLPEATHIGVLGSTNEPSGIATALEVEVARATAEKNLPVKSEYTPDAIPYHRLIGRTVGDIERYDYNSEWTPEEVNTVANLPVGPEHL